MWRVFATLPPGVDRWYDKHETEKTNLLAAETGS